MRYFDDEIIDHDKEYCEKNAGVSIDSFRERKFGEVTKGYKVIVAKLVNYDIIWEQ